VASVAQADGGRSIEETTLYCGSAGGRVAQTAVLVETLRAIAEGRLTVPSRPRSICGGRGRALDG
jgi:hypothetical protein